ncbi:MAG: ferritin-like domain-containing protein [Planctomycetales bacterium]|nr:ferritin-like domain-containing protein [bacterium]UNM08031.1 MAG: ferritin-like domain-containing protein [Planctomycetales bacterium]
MSAAKMSSNREELIQGLNHALNREVSTFLRYMISAAKIKGIVNAPVRDMYAAEVKDEIGHATYLADKIVMLGGNPVLNPDLTPPADDVLEMLKYDIAQEKIDVEGYMKLAEMADREGLAELKLRMEDQAADEASHAEMMTRLLG